MEITLAELEKKYEELGKEIEKLKNKKESKKRWRASKLDEYFFIGCNGVIYSKMDLYTEEDNYCYNSGNYYETKELAEDARYKQSLIQRYKDFILSIEEEPIDWINGDQDKYFLYVDKSKKANQTHHSIYISQGIIYSTNPKLLELAKGMFTEEELKSIVIGF